MHGMCNYHNKFSAIPITEKTINLYQPLHLCVNSRCHSKHSQIISQWMRSFLQHVVSIIIFTGTHYGCFIGSEFVNRNRNPDTLFIWQSVHSNFLYGSFLVMCLFRYYNSENIV